MNENDLSIPKPPPASEARATWSRQGDGDRFAVHVLTKPDQRSMVQVRFVWSGKVEQVHLGTLSAPNGAAERLLGLQEIVPVKRETPVPSVRPAPAAKDPPPAPVQACGEPITRAAAAVLFPAHRVQAIPQGAELRLVGRADGKVVLRARGKGGVHILDLPYVFTLGVQQGAKPSHARKSHNGR